MCPVHSSCMRARSRSGKLTSTVTWTPCFRHAGAGKSSLVNGLNMQKKYVYKDGKKVDKKINPRFAEVGVVSSHSVRTFLFHTTIG